MEEVDAVSIPIPTWAPRTTITILSGTPQTGFGPTGGKPSTLTPAGTFEGHWQPVSQQDAVKAGRTGQKEVREIWTDSLPAPLGLQSILQFDGKQWVVVGAESWPGDPVQNFLVEARS